VQALQQQVGQQQGRAVQLQVLAQQHQQQVPWAASTWEHHLCLTPGGSMPADRVCRCHRRRVVAGR
jgi:hypothetical protein